MSQCCCSSEPKTRLITACSGAANTGFLADSVARKLAKLGTGKMTCLAALGANLSGYVESARGAGENIVLDGCPTACGKHTMDNLGIPFRHVIMTSLGVEKGKTPITEELVGRITLEVAEEVSREPGAASTANAR
jgi:uncharacterized metal-binding protein